jgi:hypothetical protein
VIRRRQIDVGPAKRGKLAAAHPTSDHERDQRPMPGLLGFGKELRDRRGFVRLRLALLNARHVFITQAVRDVAHELVEPQDIRAARAANRAHAGRSFRRGVYRRGRPRGQRTDVRVAGKRPLPSTSAPESIAVAPFGGFRFGCRSERAETAPKVCC